MKTRVHGMKPQDNSKGDKMKRVTTYQTFERVLEVLKKEVHIKNIPPQHKANFLASALKIDIDDVALYANGNVLPTRHIVHFCLDRGLSVDAMIY